MDFGQFKQKLLAYLDQNKDSEELKEKINLRKQFNDEFPIETLRGMSLEDYAIGNGSKDTFCYLIERGRYKQVGVGIGGDTALKFGIYFSKTDNSYQICKIGKKHMAPDDPDAFWREFRTELCDFLAEAKESGTIRADFVEQYPKLKGLGMLLNKLLFAYNPQRFLNITNQPAIFAFEALGEPDLVSLDRVVKPNVLWDKLRQAIPEVNSPEYDPQLIGDALFSISKEQPRPEKPVQISKGASGTEEREPVAGGKNEIYYGTPGCGKSYLVQKEYGNKSNDFGISIRTVFHPDYTNSDFVGQVVPATTADGAVRYDFVPGPFTEALREALRRPDLRVSLIIDEINRGNASAIFGDIIQLLDRDSNDESEYSIHNKAISDYLNRSGISAVEDDITLPSNLWIIGTMNTSDQNVFPLDTAFKRRWIMHKIRNDFKNVDSNFANMYIPGTGVKWKEFVTKVNQKIARSQSYGLNSDDKQIGVYFVNGDALSRAAHDSDLEKKMAFGEKILMYIWEDVAKLNRTDWFGDKVSSLDELLDEFEKNGLKVFSGIDFVEDGHEENA